jgi:formylglycine-generating enzyme required for sulfatase activity
VRREALRLRAIAACALGDHEALRSALERALADPELLAARRLGLERFAERCGHTLVAKTKTSEPTPGAAPTNAPATPVCPPGMLPLPGGKFWVGSEPKEERSSDESPRYLTELAPFCFDETEVTVKAYGDCVSAGRCEKAERGRILCNFGREERKAHPINCLSWKLADRYCKLRGARLPTEAEFEYATRGGGEYRKYPWGDAAPDGHTCWKHNGSCDVKTFAAGAFGLFDVSGNVWEWTDDWYGPYPWPPPTGFAKVYRGGGFSRRFEKWMDPRLRNRGSPRDEGAQLGFRCALTLDAGRCPFGVESPGRCRHGVRELACGDGRSFNGVRCVKPGEPRCPDGGAEKTGYGCVPERKIVPEIEDVEAAVARVTNARSPEFDGDCAANAPGRPRAFRYAGGSHAARNQVSKGAGCKNRDVGVGWNSTCCP